MRILLDTHCLLWWFVDDPRLSDSARSAILDEANEVFVSAASAWEISTKARLGKLDGLPVVVGRFVELVAADGFQSLPISPMHACRAGAYPQPHRDPFDRMLAAQSELDSLLLVTRDPAFEAFGTRTLW
jgi:PIN domain nuclease of toxin-antitoxin system